MGLRILKKLIPCVVAGSLLFNGIPGIGIGGRGRISFGL